MFDTNTNQAPALVYNSNDTIVIRGKYDYNKSAYIPEQVTALQASEAFTAAEYLEKHNNTYRSQVDNLRDYLIEGIANESLDSDIAQEIAELFGIELVKTLQVEFTVRYSATVKVALDSDLDESDFHVQIDYAGSDNADFDNEDWEVEDFSAHEAY